MIVADGSGRCGRMRMEEGASCTPKGSREGAKEVDGKGLDGRAPRSAVE